MRFSSVLSRLTFAAVFCSAASVASAQYAVTCKVKETGDRGGWVPETIVFVVDEDKKSARVVDGMILNTLNRPANARLKITNKGQRRMSWRVDNVRTVQAFLSVSYTADFDPKTKAVSLKGNLVGASNRIRGVGSCQELNQNQLKNLGSVLGG